MMIMRRYKYNVFRAIRRCSVCDEVTGANSVFDEYYHFDGKVEVDYLAVGVAGYVRCGTVHPGYDALGIAFVDKTCEVAAKLCLFAIQI